MTQTTLTLEQARGPLRALVQVARVHEKLRSALLVAIDGLPKDFLEEVLWTLTRPATRWSIVTSLSPFIGADRAFAVVNQLPEIKEMPEGLRVAANFRRAKALRMAQQGRP